LRCGPCKLSAPSRLCVFFSPSLFQSSKFIFDSNKKEFEYFLLNMKYTDIGAMVTVRGYKSSQLHDATEEYLELERESSNDSSHDVVLVSAGSLKELKKAYPNYSADSKEFVKYINQVSG